MTIKNPSIAALTCLLLAGGGATTASADPLITSWSDGIRLDTEDGAVKLKLGGRMQFDSVWGIGDDELETSLGGPFVDGTEIRRIRLYVAGTVGTNLELKSQFDLAGDKIAVKDAYVGLIGLPSGFGVRVGHFKEPFSIEQLTSAKYIAFLERSLADVFAPSRNAGVMLHNYGVAGGKVGIALGVFRETDDSVRGTDDDGAYAATARVVLMPINENKGERLVHVGAAGSFREPSGDQIQIRQRPEMHLSARFVDTEVLAVDQVALFGGEAAIGLGPFWAQAELMGAALSLMGEDTAFVTGAYGSAGYFLTGEHRGYKGGAIQRVRPASPLGAGGHGALEVAARVSRLDLDDGAVAGGVETNVTGAVNWYPSPTFRVMFDVVHADVSGGGMATSTGILHAALVRFQADF